VDELLKANADFVLRAKRTLNFAAREDQARTLLDEEDRAAGVIGDRLGRLTGSPHARAARARRTPAPHASCPTARSCARSWSSIRPTRTSRSA
jgi:hypothetical protein